MPKLDEPPFKAFHKSEFSVELAFMISLGAINERVSADQLTVRH